MYDPEIILREYLVDQTTLTDVVSTRIYCPRLPENATLPALSFITVGGMSNPHIEPIPKPTFQFDCWDDSHSGARTLYLALHSVLQGVQNQTVTIGSTAYRIMCAVEEGTGQDLVDQEIPNYFRVLAFFNIEIQA